MLWSSATLGLNPDDTVPGLVHALTSRFLQLLDVPEEKQRPNAQAAANVLWALATMGHPAATAQVVDTVCLHFECLTRHPDAEQRPNAQNCANALWALAKWGHSSAAVPEAVDSVCLHFACLCRHSDPRQRPNAQECANLLWALATMGHSAAVPEVVDPVCWHYAHLVASPNARHRPKLQAVVNLVWALGTLKHTPIDDRLLDHLCAYMHTLLQSQNDCNRPDEQNIANMLWALAQLKHAPLHDVVTAMFDRLVILCQTSSLLPTSQNISNSLLACTELGLTVRPTCVKALLKHLLEMPVSKATYQEYCYVAWSLAVRGCLHLNTFSALLNKLTTTQDLLVQAHGRNSGSVQLITADRNQLYQALASLKPATGSSQMETWVSLRSRLQAIAPDLQIPKVVVPGQAEMQADLALQCVAYKAQVPCGGYRADIVLSPCNTSVAEVIGGAP